MEVVIRVLKFPLRLNNYSKINILVQILEVLLIGKAIDLFLFVLNHLKDEVLFQISEQLGNH